MLVSTYWVVLKEFQSVPLSHLEPGLCLYQRQSYHGWRIPLVYAPVSGFLASALLEIEGKARISRYYLYTVYIRRKTCVRKATSVAKQKSPSSPPGPSKAPWVDPLKKVGNEAEATEAALANSIPTGETAARRSLEKEQELSRKDVRMTMVLLGIVLTFFFCHLPRSVSSRSFSSTLSHSCHSSPEYYSTCTNSSWWRRSRRVGRSSVRPLGSWSPSPSATSVSSSTRPWTYSFTARWGRSSGAWTMRAWQPCWPTRASMKIKLYCSSLSKARTKFDLAHPKNWLNPNLLVFLAPKAKPRRTFGLERSRLDAAWARSIFGHLPFAVVFLWGHGRQNKSEWGLLLL